MPGDVLLVCSIPRKVFEMYKRGELKWGKGGFTRNGKFYKLVDPVIQIDADGPITTPVSLIPRLIGPDARAMLQNQSTMLKTLSRQMDLSLQQLQSIEKSLSSIANINALSWANCALNVANCGISMAGFAMVLQQMNRLSGQVKALADLVDQTIRSELMERFDRYCLNLQSCLHSLETAVFDAAYSLNLEKHLNESAAFMNRLIRDIQQSCAYTDLAVSMLFGLATPFAHVVREYAVKYYYAHNAAPANLESWLSVLSSLIGWDFNKALKRHLLYSHLELTMEQRYAAYTGGYTAAQLQLGNLAFSQMLTKALPEKTYITLDEVIGGRMEAGNYIVQGDLVGIPIASVQ